MKKLQLICYNLRHKISYLSDITYLREQLILLEIFNEKELHNLLQDNNMKSMNNLHININNFGKLDIINKFNTARVVAKITKRVKYFINKEK